MKKYNVFKVLFITTLVAMVCSFVIPQSQIGYTGIEKGEINPITFIDSISNGLTSFSVFIASFVYILSIGIFYAILKKSDKYEAVVNNTAAKFKNKKVFIIISVLTFGLLTSVIGDMMPMLIFVPVFMDIAKKLGYDSKAAILSTIGAIIFGSVGSLYTNYTNQILAVSVTTNIILKVIILIVSLIGLILFVIFGSKAKSVKLEKINVKKTLPIVIAFDVILILIILGMTPWKAYFNFNGFADFHKALVDFKVLKVSLFNAILGRTLLAFGEWSIYSVIVLLLVVSVVLSLIYKLKVDNFLETVANGIKKALPYALIIVFANIVLVGVYNSGFFVTVINAIGSMKDKILSATTVSLLSSIVYPDYGYAAQFTVSTLAVVISKKAIYVTLAVIFQFIYSLALLISPTSVLLLIGLRYENIRYKDWFKYISKFFLLVFIVYYIVIMIIGGKFVKAISYVVLAVLVIILALLFVLKKGKKETVTIVKEETKEEKTEKVKKETKKTTTKKTTNKKK